jgi:hypothetical protein
VSAVLVLAGEIGGKVRLSGAGMGRVGAGC